MADVTNTNQTETNTENQTNTTIENSVAEKPETGSPTVEELMSQLASERAEKEKYKNASDKASSEAAKYKKELRSKQTAEEQEAEAKREAEEAKERHTKELEEKLAKIDAQKRFMAIGMSEEMAEEAATAELAGESDKVTELYKKFNDASIKAAQAEWQKSRPPVNAGQGEEGKDDPFLKGFNG